MTITFYDLAGGDGRRFSPFGWRVRMALAHKGLEAAAAVERVTFSQKDKLAFSGQELVPVIVDDGTVVPDSWQIALHLDRAHGQEPSLFAATGTNAARFFAAWTDSQLHPLIARCVVCDIPVVLDPADHAYFRRSREARFGTTLEAMAEGRDTARAELKRALYPVRKGVEAGGFLSGSSPGYADYAVFGAFMWARGVSGFRLLEEDDPVHAWRERMLDLHDAMPRTEPGFPV